MCASPKIEWVERACPLCGAGVGARIFAESNIDMGRLNEYAFASRKLPEYMHPRLFECESCHLLYGNPVLAPKLIAGLYGEAAFDSAPEARYASITYQHLLQRIVPHLPDRQGALDIGTGDGAFLERLIECGFSGVCGVEPSAAPIEAASPKVRALIRHGLFDPANFEPRSFSLITCFQVMEHVWDPLELCRGALGLLKPGGALVTVLHNRYALSARILGTKSPIFDIEHLQLFSVDSSRRLLQLAGFSDVRVAPVWNRYPLHYWIKLFPLPQAIKQKAVSYTSQARVFRVPVPLPAGNLLVWGVRST
jgi:SAM-dependent methyltransferase